MVTTSMETAKEYKSICVKDFNKISLQVLLVTGGSGGGYGNDIDSTEFLAEDQASWQFGPNLPRKPFAFSHKILMSHHS